MMTDKNGLKVSRQMMVVLACFFLLGPIQFWHFLLCPRERQRSIVISMIMCVCWSACPRWYLPNHIRDLNQIFMDVAYGCGLVLQRVYEIPKARGNLGSFLPHWHCIVWAVFWYEFRYKGPIWLKFTYLL